MMKIIYSINMSCPVRLRISDDIIKRIRYWKKRLNNITVGNNESLSAQIICNTVKRFDFTDRSGEIGEDDYCSFWIQIHKDYFDILMSGYEHEDYIFYHIKNISDIEDITFTDNYLRYRDEDVLGDSRIKPLMEYMEHNLMGNDIRKKLDNTIEQKKYK